MSHIHIALVGGQVYPIYLTIAALEPDRVILLHSEQSSAEAERLKAEVEAGVKADVEMRTVDPVNLLLISESFKSLFADIPGDAQCTVNLTGGTKPWSVLLYQIFQKKEKISFFYVDQNNFIYDFESLQKYSSIPLDMDLLFRLNGNAVKSKVAFAEYTEDDFAVMRKLKSLTEKYSKLYFKFASEANCDKPAPLRIGESSVDWHREKDRQSVCIKFVNQGKKGSCCEQLESKHAADLFFKYHWFELNVAEILSKWDKAKEVWMNVEFPYKNNLPKNEIDIIVNTGDKLLFVECKTRICDNTNIDKFSAAVKNYGGMASKALFVSNMPMDDKPIEKCEQNGIMHFALIQKVDRCWHSADVRKLYGMLDKALFEINKK